MSEAQSEADAWLLPLDEYTFTSAYGVRFAKLHAGIDLAAPEGTPFTSIHRGTVTQAGYNGAYGYAVTVQHDDGTETIYGHARRVLVHFGTTATPAEGGLMGRVRAILERAAVEQILEMMMLHA